jgi:hypothetical protein
VALAHFLYCHFLHEKRIADTITQERNSQINNAFTQLFSWTLAASASAAFTQLFWSYLRTKPVKVSTIDALFTLTSSPWNLFNIDGLKYAPILWLFGALFPSISIAVILPPGALVVGLLPRNHNLTGMTISSLDVGFRGNGTVAGMWENAMFLEGGDGEYR